MDVTGIEPATLCLQRLNPQRVNHVHRVRRNATDRYKFSTRERLLCEADARYHSLGRVGDEIPSQIRAGPAMDAQRSIFAGALEVDCRTISSGSTAISST